MKNRWTYVTFQTRFFFIIQSFHIFFFFTKSIFVLRMFHFIFFCICFTRHFSIYIFFLCKGKNKFLSDYEIELFPVNETKIWEIYFYFYFQKCILRVQCIFCVCLLRTAGHARYPNCVLLQFLSTLGVGQLVAEYSQTVQMQHDTQKNHGSGAVTCCSSIDDHGCATISYLFFFSPFQIMVHLKHSYLQPFTPVCCVCVPFDYSAVQHPSGSYSNAMANYLIRYSHF